jgi:hypothetical protein
MIWGLLLIAVIVAVVGVAVSDLLRDIESAIRELEPDRSWEDE